MRERWITDMRRKVRAIITYPGHGIALVSIWRTDDEARRSTQKLLVYETASAGAAKSARKSITEVRT